MHVSVFTDYVTVMLMASHSTKDKETTAQNSSRNQGRSEPQRRRGLALLVLILP